MTLTLALALALARTLPPPPGGLGSGGRKFALRVYLLLVAPAARQGVVVGGL